MLARRLMDHDDTPVDDRIVVLRGATWADYKRLLEMRGEVSSPPAEPRRRRLRGNTA